MKLPNIGSVNACGIATLYNGTTLVGNCLDTPNAIACCIGNGHGTSAMGMFGKVTLDTNRVENKGWMDLNSAKFEGTK